MTKRAGQSLLKPSRKFLFYEQKENRVSVSNVQVGYEHSCMAMGYEKDIFGSLRMNLNSHRSLVSIYAIVNIVSILIPIYRNGSKAKLQTMARTRNFYFIFIFCASVCKVTATSNYFTPSINFRHSSRAEALRCFVFKMKNVSLF